MKELISISTVVVGDDEINCYKAQEVGLQIMNDKISENFNYVKLKRINRNSGISQKNNNSNQRRSYFNRSIVTFPKNNVKSEYG